MGVSMDEATPKKLLCRRCNWTWTQRLPFPPAICPRCKRRNWHDEGPTPFEARRDLNRSKKAARHERWLARLALSAKRKEAEAARRLERARYLVAMRTEKARLRQEKMVARAQRKEPGLPELARARYEVKPTPADASSST